MIYSGDKKTVIYKGDFHPAQLYKGNKKIAGYSVEEFEGLGGAILATCYNDSLHNVVIHGNSIQDGTPSPEAPIEIQSVGELVTEGDYAGKYKIGITAHGENGESESFNIYLDEPLRKLGDYADYVDFGKSMVVRSVKKLLLSGSEDWKESGYNNQIKIDYIQFWTDYCRNITGGYVALSNKFKCVGQKEWSDLKLEQEFLAVTSVRDFGIRLSTSKVTSLNEFTKWLSENNAVLLFSLITPTEEPIKLPELPTFKGTTIYEIDTQITATISGKYKRTEV